MQNEDLGEFLFEDAWKRFSPALRHLLLLMTRISDAHDDALLNLCCNQTKLARNDAIAGLEESRGIASSTSIHGVTHLQFTPEFVHFCEDKTEQIGGRALPSRDSVERIRKRYDHFVRARSQRVADKFKAAYRKPFAKMAYQSFVEGDYPEAEEHYELAIDEDPANGMLFERFANSLLLMGKATEAERRAERATELEPSSAQTWFTRGRIKAELGDTVGTAMAMSHAEKLGHRDFECLYQRARSYYKSPDLCLPDVQRHLKKAQQALFASPVGEAERKKWEGMIEKMESKAMWRNNAARRPKRY